MVAMPVFGYYCWVYAPDMQWVEAADVAKGPLRQGGFPPGSRPAESGYDAWITRCL